MREAEVLEATDYVASWFQHMAGFYNNLNEESEQKTWGNYGPNYPRLVELKNKYDPGILSTIAASERIGR